MTGREQADRSQRAKEREDLAALTDEQKKARRNKKAREARAAKKMKEQGLEVVDEEILTESYIERVDIIASTAPARIESSITGRKRSVSKVSISSDSFEEDAALFYQSDESTGEPGPAPSSPPRSGQQPFIWSQQSVEEDEFPIDEDDDAMLALAEAQVSFARKEAETKAIGKGKGRKVETEAIAVLKAAVDLEAAVELTAAVTRRPQRQRKNARLYGDSQTWDKYVEHGDI